MKFTSINRVFTAALIISAALLAACEGDSRPFEEAFEVEALGLTSLQVVPPANTQEKIFINPGQLMQLSLSGSTVVADTTVEVDATNRSWRSSNPDVLTVSDDGLVTGVGLDEGPAQVFVTIGGVSSTVLDITVRQAELETFNAIVGSATLERCLPDEYYAVGNFDDLTTRTLFDVDFQVVDETTAMITDEDPAIAIVNATTAGELTLTAQVGDKGPFPLQLNVLNNLTSIAITPETATVNEGNTIGFVAQGTYNTEGMDTGEDDDDLEVPAAPGTPNAPANTKILDISANVDWEVTSGPTIASVDNSGENRGRVLGLSAGTAVVTASCGTDRRDSATATVIDVADDDSDELSFDVVGSRFVLAFGETRQLRVSRGGTFDSDEALSVADGIRYSVRNADLNFINQGSLASGLINPIVQGVEIVVTAQLLDDDDEVVASGSLTIEIQ